MKALFKSLRNCLLRVQIPSHLLNRAEKSFALAQGKGWGTSTVGFEVNSCFKLLGKNPLDAHPHGIKLLGQCYKKLKTLNKLNLNFD